MLVSARWLLFLRQNNIKTDVSRRIGNSRDLDLCLSLFAVRRRGRNLEN